MNCITLSLSDHLAAGLRIGGHSPRQCTRSTTAPASSGQTSVRRMENDMKSKKPFNPRNAVLNKKHDDEPNLPPWFTDETARCERYGEVQYELFPNLKVEWGSPYRDPAKEAADGRL